jgi:hypothetical protein
MDGCNNDTLVALLRGKEIVRECACADALVQRSCSTVQLEAQNAHELHPTPYTSKKRNQRRGGGVLRALELDDALGRERNLLALNIGHLRACVRVYVRASSDHRRRSQGGME